MVHKKGHISENTVWYWYVPVRCHQYHTAVPYVALPYTIYQYRSYGTGDTMRSSDRALRHYRQRTDVTSGIRYSPPDRAIASLLALLSLRVHTDARVQGLFISYTYAALYAHPPGRGIFNSCLRIRMRTESHWLSIGIHCISSRLRISRWPPTLVVCNGPS